MTWVRVTKWSEEEYLVRRTVRTKDLKRHVRF